MLKLREFKLRLKEETLQYKSQQEMYQLIWHNVTLEEAGLSRSVVYRLNSAGYETVADLLTTTRSRLRNVYWFGKKGQAEVDALLASLGLPPIPENQPRRFGARLS